MSDDSKMEGTLEDIVPLLGLPEELLRTKLRSFLTGKQRQTMGRFFPVESERRTQVLLILAERGPLNPFQIAKELNIRYSVAHSTCGALGHAGFIKLHEKRLNEKGVIAKVYGLTLIGLSYVLVSRSTWTNNEDEIVEKWKNLDSLVLGKWDYLASKVPKNEMVKALKLAMQSAYEWIIIEKGERVGDGPRVQEILRKEFFYPGLFFGLNTYSTKRWIEAVIGDFDLKQWMGAWLREETSILRGELSSIRKVLLELGAKS